MSTLPTLTISQLKHEAASYVAALSLRSIPALFGITDGKAVGTYVEQDFRTYLLTNYAFGVGNSALGIDFPHLSVDLKVTSSQQPQSSCPFSSAGQKVYGLGYHLLVFVYAKSDDPISKSSKLDIHHAIFIDAEKTGDYQTTLGLRQLIENGADIDDIDAFLEDRSLPLDEIGRRHLAEQIINHPPELGYLTISNALQWRLQYGRAISVSRSGSTAGLEELLALT